MTALPDAQARQRLVARWASAVATTAFVPTSEEFRMGLDWLVDGIINQLLDGDPRLTAATDAGAALVALNCCGQDNLRRTLEVLGEELPRIAALAGVPDRTPTVLGQLAASYSETLHGKALDQQDEVKKALQHVLQQSEARFREIFTGSAIGIAISDIDGRLRCTNLALAEILGLKEGDLGADNLYELIGQGRGDELRVGYRDLVSGRVDRIRLERSLTRKDGELAWVYLAVSVLRDGAGAVSHLVTMVEDITDLHLMQVQLNNRALHDVLTGLPNRQSFILRVESTLGQLDPSAVVTLLHLDIDGFSVINNCLGADAGDWVLKLVARRLTDAFASERAVVARIASDEFAVLIENSAGTPSATTLAARINEELSEPVYRKGIGLAVSACVGVVQCQAGSIGHTELLRQSDATLRRAKSKGRRQWEMADRHQDGADRRRFLAAAGMPGELEIGNFRLDYRPLMRLRGDGIAAVQALLRWDHPDRGRLGHDEVVLLAEHTGMVLPLCEWMLNSACHQAQAWLSRFGEPAPPLAVSLPPAQAGDPDLVAVVNKALNETGLPAGRLHLSLPAHAMLCDEVDAEDNLRVLADMGVPMSIHGFGASPGSLLLVEDQPVTSVWIAGWLVQRIAKRPTSVTAHGLAGLVSLLHTLDVTVVIPELTTADQANWWRSAGADIACGDLFARPAPAEDLTERLASVLSSPSASQN